MEQTELQGEVLLMHNYRLLMGKYYMNWLKKLGDLMIVGGFGGFIASALATYLASCFEKHARSILLFFASLTLHLNAYTNYFFPHQQLFIFILASEQSVYDVL